jgi:dipeptidyl aminopeptidase/acylaminoacyl peptidase
VAFSRGTPPITSNDIFMMDLDGSNQTNLTKTPKINESYPDFSPTGSRVCFFRDSGYAGKAVQGYYVMDVDGSDPTLLFEDDSLGQCDWSPDGKKIAFSATGDYQKKARKAVEEAVKKAIAEGDAQKAMEKAQAVADEEVYVVNADGSGRTALTSNTAVDINPAWSPDGTKITFASDRDGDSDIYTMDADGSDVAQVTNARYDDGLDPDWQPLPGRTTPKEADGSDVDQVTKKPGVHDVDGRRPKRTVIVKPGDSLWSIGEQRLGPNASPQQVYEHTLLIYALNRDRIGPDPNLIFWRQRLLLPPLGER